MAFKIKSPLTAVGKDPKPKSKPKSKETKKMTVPEAQVRGFDEQFEIVKAKFPKSIVKRREGKLGSYTVRKGAGQFMYTPGKPIN